jgi:hypothetical protein
MLADIPQDPLIEIFRFGDGDTRFQSSVDQSLKTQNLIIFRQHGDVVLEWVWHPEPFVSHV